MKKVSENAFKKMFFIGALWNIIAGSGAFISLEQNIKLLFGAEYIQLFFDNHVALSIYRLFWILVILFGIGYYFVSRDLEKNRGIVWMGAIGKVAVFITWSYDYFIGKATILAFLGSTGDLIFAILFILFLWQTKNSDFSTAATR